MFYQGQTINFRVALFEDDAKTTPLPDINNYDITIMVKSILMPSNVVILKSAITILPQSIIAFSISAIDCMKLKGKTYLSITLKKDDTQIGEMKVFDVEPLNSRV